MKVIALILIGRNTFLRFEMENHDDSRERIEEDAEDFARRIGGTLINLEDPE